MKIYYYKHEHGNVGDDLNPWLWPKLLSCEFSGIRFHGLPNVDETDTESLFVGIGTLLNSQIPNNCKKAIFGTGTGYGNTVARENCKYYAVRGPLTAERLGLPKSAVVTDSAALIATLNIKSHAEKNLVSLMPHHESAETGHWEIIAERLGFNFINPNQSPDTVITEILKSKLVITEAMHGAILADTLRTPWVPYLTTYGKHEFKWNDWCSSLNIEYDPLRFYGLWRSDGLLSKLKNSIKTEANILKLKKIILSKKSNLSKDIVFSEKVGLLQERLFDFERDYKNGFFF